MADVFISYHRSKGSSALVKRIAGELENKGVTCWYDTKNKAPGDFVKRILTEIESCKAFLFLWDEKANEDSKNANSYVRSEIQWAYNEKHIALFPFQVGNFEQNKILKFYFSHINILYGGNSLETAHIGELVKAIVDFVQPLPVKPEKPVKPSKIIKPKECGAWGDNVTYALNQNSVLTISGKGAMRDFERHILSAYKIPWRRQRKIISRVKIQDGVTTIGRWSFNGCAKLIRISIPDSVTFVGEGAFRGCAKLTSVSVPVNAEIEDGAFPHTIHVTRRAPKSLQRR